MRTNLWRVTSILVLLAMFISPVGSAYATPAAPSSAQSAQTDASIQVEDALVQQFEQQGSAGYLIYFRSKADLTAASKMGWNERGQFVLKTLQKTALDKQANVRAYLDAQGVKYQSFWIDNIIAVDSSTNQVFNGLMAFPEIQSLKARRTMGIIEPKLEPVSQHLFAVESNLTHINADDVWALGYEGQGVTIANIDTGVRYTHQAVNAQYRGNLGGGVYNHNYNWFDPMGTYPTAPGDEHGHGTHTMGTMVGDDGGANQIGMAPSADWMACRACSSTAGCPGTALLACAQFITAPTDLAGDNPDPTKRPVAVNNSWGDCGTSYDNWYQGVVDSWQAAGIYPIFSNGNASNCGYNDPPGLNTVGNPARYGNVTGVGSTGQNDGQYATHSNWGPTDNLDTINPNPNDAFGAALKPQVLAPGVNIRSSVNTSDSSYESWAGTSMSSPHVTGLIALIVQAAPCLAGDYATIETIIEDTAVPVPYASGGSPAPPAGNAINYATGHGEIDALAAVNMALSMCGTSTLSGTITDSETGNPVAGATVDVVNATTNRHVSTNAAGVYTTKLFDGTYDVTFSKYAYVSQTSSVTVTGSATKNVALVPAGIYTVSGTVTDGTTGWPLYARLNISGYPGSPVFTNPVTGAYSVPLPSGSYTFTVSAMSGGYADSVVPVVVAGTSTQDFGLLANLAACTAPGYGMTPPSFSENFETWPLTGWTIVDNIVGGGLVWDSNAAYGDSNWTSGAGLSADVNSDKNMGVDYDTELITPVIDPTTLASEILSYRTRFVKYSLGSEAFDLDIKNAGDLDWTNISSWTTSQSGLISVDLASYITGNFQLRWHYYTPKVDPWDFYAQVDEVGIGSDCVPTPSTGLVIGSVFDANTSTLLLNASVQDAALNSALLIDASADPATPDQMYVIAEPAGAVTLTASTTSLYGTDTQTPTVVAGGTVKQDFNLPVGKLSASPASLSFSVSTASSLSKPLALNNVGGLAADYQVGAISGTAPSSVPAPTGPFAERTTPAGKFERTAPNTSKIQGGFTAPNAIKINGGEISTSWPTGLASAWGIGFNTTAGDLWLSNPSGIGGDDFNYNFTTAGVNTGNKIDISSLLVFNADMTYNPFTNTLWQVNVYDDNCIHELDPVAKTVTGNKICPDFGGYAERGLAFDPVTNTYYSGSWEDKVIYHFAPDGTILDSKFVGLSIAGLAFNPSTGHLFVMTNAPSTSNALYLDVYVLDTANNYMALGGFNLRDGAVKAFGDNDQAGLEIDCAGNLWAVDQTAQKVYVADSGETG
jgi:subtilisin family serine protease